MSLKNTENSYGVVTKWLHWTVSILVISLVIAGFSFDFINDKPTLHQVVMLHKSFGLIVLGLMVLRLLWRWQNTRPTLPGPMPLWEVILERSTHFLWYVVLLLMPLSGWMMATAAGKAPNFFNWVALSMPGVAKNDGLKHFAHETHEILAFVIVALFILHVAGALKHHFINRDNVLRRML